MKKVVDSPRTPSTPRTPKSPMLSFPKSSLFRKKAAEEYDPFADLTGDELIKARLQHAYQQDDKLPRLIDDDHIREQSLDDYYIKLKIVLRDGAQDKSSAAEIESVEGTKRPIDITELFGQIEGDSTEASKLLLLGAAGIGKSTLMHYMSYRWSKGDLWNDKYDFIFRVRLKNLLNDDWSKFDKTYDLRDKPLECFVHSCLPRELQRDISVADIARILTEGEGAGARALLLLDGYDEVASRVAENGSIPAKIFEQVFDCQNVILTSRPNAIRDSLKKQFERVIENVGLDDYGIAQYIENAFRVQVESESAAAEDIAAKTTSSMKSSTSSKKVTTATDGQVVRRSVHEDESGTIAKFTKESQVASRDLKDFLGHNSTIKDICTVPINTALVCLIWRDAREKLFAENFNMSTLYKEVVLWLGKRHLKKFNEKFVASELEEIDADSIYGSNELKSLKEAAYKGFADSESLILSGKDIKKYIKDIWPTSLAESADILELVHKFGLLKSEQDSKKLIENDFTFIHLTFQEYLMALSFREMLESNSVLEIGAEAQQRMHQQEQIIGEFLATHREEPRYLRSLQFLTAIIEEERNDSTQNQEQIQSVVTRFWEVMTCNMDGIIELGVEGKVKLLMYLLGQVKAHPQDEAGQSTGEFIRAQIPNLQAMRDFVDEEIFKDIDHWIGEIKASEYKPKKLDAYITEKLDNLAANEAILSSLFELINIAKYSAAKLTQIIEGIMLILDNVSVSDAHTISASTQDSPAADTSHGDELATSNSDNWRLQKAIIANLPKIVRSDLDFGFQRELITRYQQFVQQSDGVHNDVKLAAIFNIAQLASNMDALEKVIANSLLELQSSNYDQDSYACNVQMLGDSMRYFNPDRIDLMQQNLLPMLYDARNVVRKFIVKLINRSIQLKPDSVVMVLGYLLPKMLHVSLEEQDSIAQIMAKCVDKESRVVDVVLSRIVPQLKSKNPEVKKTALKLVEKCVVCSSQFISTELIDKLVSMLKGNEEIRGLSARIIRKIIHQDQEGAEHTEYVLRKLQPLLKSWTEDIRETAEMLVREGNSLAKDKTVLSTKTAVATEDSVLVEDSHIKLLMDLQSDNLNVVVTSLRIIVGYAKATNTMTEGVLEHLPKLFRSRDSEVRESAVNALVAYMEVAKSSPEILSDEKIGLGQAFGIIQELAKDTGYNSEYVRKSAVNALVAYMEVAKSSPEILSDEKIGLGQAFGIIQELAKDTGYNSEYVRKSAVNALVAYMEVAKSSPEILSDEKIVLGQAFGLIQELAKDSKWQAKESAGNALVAYMEVAKSSPEILSDEKIGLGQAFGIIQELAKDDSEYGFVVRKSAVNALVAYMEVAKSSPEILSDEKIVLGQAFGLIQELAKDESENGWAAKQSAGNALVAYMEVAKSSPEILSDEKIGLGQAFGIIQELAKDGDYDVRKSAGNALVAYMEVAKSSPEILSDEKIGLGQAFGLILEWARTTNDPYGYAKQSAGNALVAYMEVAKSSPEILYDEKIGLGQAFGIIQELAKDTGYNSEYVRKSAVNALVAYMEVAKSSPEILYDEKIGLGQAFGIIQELAKDYSIDVRKSAVKALVAYMEVAKSSPEILSDEKIGLGQAFGIIQELAKDGDYDVRKSAVNALVAYMEVAKSSPEILSDEKIGLGQAFGIIQELAKDRGYNSEYVRKSAVNALVAYMEVAKSSPEILYDEKIGLGQAFGIIQELAKDYSIDVRKSAVNALVAYMEVAKSSPEILSDEKIGLGQAFGIIQELAKDSHPYAKQSAGNALVAYMEVAKSSPEILSDEKIGLGQAFGIIQELAKDDSEYGFVVRKSAVNALVAYMEVAKSSPEILSDEKIGLGQAFGLIQELAKDSHPYAKQSAGNALVAYMEVAKSSPEILSDEKIGLGQAFSIIQELAKDTGYNSEYVRKSAVNALVAYMEVAKSSPEILSDEKIGLGQAFGLIQELAKDESENGWAAKQSAGNALVAYMEVAKSSPEILYDEKIGLGQAFGIIQELAKDENWRSKESAVNAVVAYMEVAKSSPEILSDEKIGLGQAFGIIQELAGNKTQEIGKFATGILGEYLCVNFTLAKKEFLLQLLAYLHEEEVQNSILKGMSVCIAHSDDYRLVKKLSDKYLPLLESDDPALKQTAVIALINSNFAFLNADDDSLFDFAVPYLGLEQKYKELAIKALAKGISGLNKSQSLTNLEKISKIAMILKYSKQLREESEREIVEDSEDKEVIATNEVIRAAEKLLVKLPEILLNNIPAKEEFSEFIQFLEFINAEFDSIYSEGVRKSFEKLYVRLLEFEALNPEQMLDVSRELILKLLAQGFTTSFDLRNNEIIFEGKHYKIVSDSEVMQEFAEQAAEGSAHLGNKLAQQYVDHAPLFKSSGSALDISGSDIASCVGVLSRQELNHRTYNASLVVRSNHEDEVLESFILLEQRLVTGQYRYHKIVLDGSTLGINNVDLMPGEVKEQLSLIFDRMEYAKIGGRFEQPLYYALTRISVDRETIKSLLSELDGATMDSMDALSYFAMRFGLVDDIDGREEGTGEFTFADFKSVATVWNKKELLQLESGSDAERVYLENEASFRLQQFAHDKDYAQKQITELTKLAEALKGQFATLDEAARGAEQQFALLKETNDTAHQRIDELFSERDSLQLRLDTLQGQQEADHKAIEEMDQVKARLAQLNDTVEEVKSDVSSALEMKALFEQLIGEADVLSRVVETQKAAEATQADIDSIISDPYQKAFYETLRMELNSGYLAASAIESGWISNNKKGKLGNLGGFVKEASSAVPIVGAGVKMLGTILQMADNKQQKKMIKNYAKFVTDSSEMNELAEEISRKIILSGIELTAEEETMFGKIKSMLLEKVGGTFTSKVGSAATKIAGFITKIPTSMDDISDMAGEMLSAVPTILAHSAEGAAETLREDLTSSAQNAAMEAASDRLAEVEEVSKQIRLGEEHAHKIAKIITAAIFAGKFKAGAVQEKAELIKKTVIEKLTDTEAGIDATTNQEEKIELESSISRGQEETKNEGATEHLAGSVITAPEEEPAAILLSSLTTTSQDEADTILPMLGDGSGFTESVI